MPHRDRFGGDRSSAAVCPNGRFADFLDASGHHFDRREWAGRGLAGSGDRCSIAVIKRGNPYGWSRPEVSRSWLSMPTPEAVIHKPTVMAARSQARSPVVVDPPATPHSERKPGTLYRSTNQADQRFEAALLAIIECGLGLAEEHARALRADIARLTCHTARKYFIRICGGNNRANRKARD